MVEFLLLICLIILAVLVWKPVKKAVLSALDGRAEKIRSELDEGVGPRRDAHVGDHHRRRPTCRFDALAHRGRRVGVDVVDDHLRAVGSQPGGDRGADAAAGPGDEGDASGEAVGHQNERPSPYDSAITLRAISLVIGPMR